MNTTVIPVHEHVPGRLRVFLPGLYRRAALKEPVESAVIRVIGVHGAQANPVTGNLLVRCDPALSTSQVIDSVRSALLTVGTSGERIREVANGWHHSEVDALSRRFGVSPEEGLPAAEVRRRLQKYGKNVLSAYRARSDFRILIHQFKGFPVLLLTGAAVLSAATGGVLDAVVIMGVVVVNAGVGFITERQVERTLLALNRPRDIGVLTLREGAKLTLSADELVPGDVIFLGRGDVVPADARLIECNHFTVDESSLTGESVGVEKTSEVIETVRVSLADRRNMVCRDTVVTGGRAKALVVATGSSTEIGEVKRLVDLTRSPRTPIQEELAQLGRRAANVSLGICTAVMAVGFLRGYRFVEMLKTSVSLAVAAIPEGLPAVATTTLAQGVRELRNKNIMIRRLDTIEALGSVHVICLDKTGTITMNEMRVEAVDTANRGYRIDTDASIALADPDVKRLLELVVLCNEAEVTGPGAGRVNGSSTEVALIRAAMNAGMDVARLRREQPIRRAKHRMERRRYMVTSHGKGESSFEAIKGQPEAVLEKCGHCLRDGKVVELTDSERDRILSRNDRRAAESMRVLGVAFEQPRGRRVWVGLVGLRDVMRPGVQKLVEALDMAGIKSMIVTGDQSLTARAIGGELGVGEGALPLALDAEQFEHLSPEELSRAVESASVFSRVSPAHKMRIVRALQEGGRIVAMTGDGINDGPALKAANIGLAMGGAGKDVAREVADMVLLDDRIEGVITAIEKGRTISDDIRKSIEFILATNFAEMMIPLLSLSTGLGQPLSAMQLLWINIITDIFPELALALEPAEPDILTRPPRARTAGIVPEDDYGKLFFQGGVISLSTLASYGYGLLRYGAGARASTMAFVGLITTQLLHSISARSDRVSVFDGVLNGRKRVRLPANPYLTLAITGSLATEVLAVGLPGFRRVLGTTSVRPADIAVCGGSAMASFLVNEAFKAINNRGDQDDAVA